MPQWSQECKKIKQNIGALFDSPFYTILKKYLIIIVLVYKLATGGQQSRVPLVMIILNHNQQ